MSQGVQQRAEGSNANSNQIVHMRGDSDSQLAELFSVLKNVDGPPQNSSYRNRNLPASFFKPPTAGAGNHSREGSQDSSSFAPTQPAPGLSISHARSQSSPAQLPRTMTAAPPPPHAKQVSVDLAEDLNNIQGWDVKQSPTNQQSQWQPPQNKSLSNSSLNSPQQTLSPNQSLGASPNVSLQDLGGRDLGPLPAGWEQSTTENGEIYYINHMEKATSWFDPRIPKHLQRPGPMKMQPQLQQQQPPPQLPRLSDCVQQAPPQHAQLLSQPGGPPQLAQPSPQQQQQLSPNNQQTSTPQPQLQPQMQRKPVPNEQYIKLEFQKLERDKERLRREQDEIQKRELKLKKLLKDMASVLTTSTANDPMADGMGAQSPMHATGVDPFLGHGGNITDNHARQNSGDSGLGGMNNYSLPRTPEDILSNVDEMDTQDGGKLHKHMNSDFNMNDLQGTMTGMDMNLGEATNNPTGMDSDDLVPSLQEDIGTALLSDMDVQKMDNLLWL